MSILFNRSQFNAQYEILNFINAHPFELPKIKKVVIHSQVKQTKLTNAQLLLLNFAFELITLQKATSIKAKKSVAAFKLRSGMIIGSKVTLRKFYMYNFLNNFTFRVLPRNKKYIGYNFKQIDKYHSFTLGLENLFFFPEIAYYYEKFQPLDGCDIIFTIKSLNNKTTMLFLNFLNIPVIKK